VVSKPTQKNPPTRVAPKLVCCGWTMGEKKSCKQDARKISGLEGVLKSHK
jgi:hypothetical protein